MVDSVNEAEMGSGPHREVSTGDTLGEARRGSHSCSTKQ